MYHHTMRRLRPTAWTHDSCGGASRSSMRACITYPTSDQRLLQPPTYDFCDRVLLGEGPTRRSEMHRGSLWSNAGRRVGILAGHARLWARQRASAWRFLINRWWRDYVRWELEGVEQGGAPYTRYSPSPTTRVDRPCGSTRPNSAPTCYPDTILRRLFTEAG
jgi:hypothetical protein